MKVPMAVRDLLSAEMARLRGIMEANKKEHDNYAEAERRLEAIQAFATQSFNEEVNEREVEA